MFILFIRTYTTHHTSWYLYDFSIYNHSGNYLADKLVIIPLSLVVGLNFILFLASMGDMQKTEEEIKHKWSDLDNE